MFAEENMIDVLVTHRGVVTFQHIAAPPGLLLVLEQGVKILCATGEDWEAAVAAECNHHTPQFGCQPGYG